MRDTERDRERDRERTVDGTDARDSEQTHSMIEFRGLRSPTGGDPNRDGMFAKYLLRT